MRLQAGSKQKGSRQSLDDYIDVYTQYEKSLEYREMEINVKTTLYDFDETYPTRTALKVDGHWSIWELWKDKNGHTVADYLSAVTFQLEDRVYYGYYNNTSTTSTGTNCWTTPQIYVFVYSQPTDRVISNVYSIKYSSGDTGTVEKVRQGMELLSRILY